ncbi:MAG: hypothetical protein JW842_06380, partial [Prolixibacteraceae bacterium]|nr:hypothetical protein [Prolixibacteraceae bacterium]
MGSGYQKRDFEVIDYNLYHLPKIKHPLRGPANNKLKKNNYICCIGAAQTFGCYVDEPYPYLIQKELNISTLNLGFSGAGPSFFLNKKHYLRYINNGKFAILQVLSGRSESNSLLLSRNGKGMLELNGESMPAAKAYQFIV